jgi:hypothetical protein
MLTPNELRERSKQGAITAALKAEQKVKRDREEAVEREQARLMKEALTAREVINLAYDSMLKAADEGLSVVRVWEIPEQDMIGGPTISYKGVSQLIIDHFKGTEFSVVVDTNDYLYSGTQNNTTLCVQGSLAGHAKHFIKVGW